MAMDRGARGGGGSFTLPSIFGLGRTRTGDGEEAAAAAASRAALERQLEVYPWLLSNSRPRVPEPTDLWSQLAARQRLTLAARRAQRLFPSADYPFPAQFVEDTAATAPLVLGLLNRPGNEDGGGAAAGLAAGNGLSAAAAEAERLQPLMTRGLAERFAAGAVALRRRHGLVVELGLPGLASGDELAAAAASGHADSAVAAALAKRTSATAVHITFGPHPVPPGYARQDWFGFLTLHVPAEDAEFESQPRQKRVLQAAMDAGAYVRATVRVDWPVELAVRDARSGLLRLRDRRPFFHMQLVTPHFTPYDEVFEPIRGAEKYDRGWRLKFDWRVADVDHLVEADRRRAASAEEKD
ncbi:hypothetical protein HK405_010854 [Cladochytrium tenue]|nr:hypothetical protein HK405_010854 [Cladochytrium tenue]